MCTKYKVYYAQETQHHKKVYNSFLKKKKKKPCLLYNKQHLYFCCHLKNNANECSCCYCNQRHFATNTMHTLCLKEIEHCFGYWKRLYTLK